MIRETRELLAALSTLNREVPNVVLGILDDTLPIEKQIEFGDLLIVAGRALRNHARTKRAVIIDATAANFGEVSST